MNQRILWIQRGVLALILLVVLMWLSIEWALQANAGVFAGDGTSRGQAVAAAQENWQCVVMAGPECVLMKWLASTE